MVGSLAFQLEIFVGEAGENVHGLGMKLFHKGHHILVSLGEFFAVSSVAAGLALNVFSPHVALGDRQMPKDVTECEFAGGVGPFDFVRRNAPRHAHSAFANSSKIMEERLNGADFHAGLVCSKTLF